MMHFKPSCEALKSCDALKKPSHELTPSHDALKPSHEAKSPRMTRHGEAEGGRADVGLLKEDGFISVGLNPAV